MVRSSRRLPIASQKWQWLPCYVQCFTTVSTCRSTAGTEKRRVMDKPKILIIDDDPDLRHALNLRFRANQYDTAFATDGFSAMAMAQKEKPDVIILDIGLPAGDGFVVLDRLQQN